MVMHLKQTIKNVSLDLIDEPTGIIRMEISPDAISALAQSISEIGLLQPILLRPAGERFEIVAGHRRYLAHKELQLDKIRALIREMTDQEAAFCRATENLARVDLTPIEEAAIFVDLVNNHKMSYQQIGTKVGKSPALVKRRMDLLKMPPQLQKALHDKKISISVAENLWPISDMTDLDYYLSFAVESGCTREVARSWTKEWKDKKRRAESPGVEGGGDFAPSEPRPVYVSCDLCIGPMEIGKETVLRVCPDCFGIIKKNI